MSVSAARADSGLAGYWRRTLEPRLLSTVRLITTADVMAEGRLVGLDEREALLEGGDGRTRAVRLGAIVAREDT